MKTVSISEINENNKGSNKVSTQNITEIVPHNIHPDKKVYRVLSRNDFGLARRLNAGVFNKKTDFKITEDHSLLVFNEDKGLKTKPVRDLDQNKDYLIYPLPFLSLNLSRTLNIKIDGEDTEIQLNYNNGIKFIISVLNRYYNDSYFPEYLNPSEDKEDYYIDVLSRIMSSIDDKKLNINKKFLISTNPDFLIGVLKGYKDFFINQNKDKDKIISKFIWHKNHNLYILSSILNYLGASYSIRYFDNNNYHVRFQLPTLFKYLSSKYRPKDGLDKIHFKLFRITFNDKDQLIKSGELVFSEKETLGSFVKAGYIELFPVKDFIFEEVKGNDVPEVMYDCITENKENNSNFTFAGLPMLDNSDGDILGLIGIHSKQGAKDCMAKFKFDELTIKDQLSGNVNNWIKMDAQMGLFLSTNAGAGGNTGLQDK